MALLRLAARVGGALGPGAAWVGCHEADTHDPCIDMAACERAVVRRWRQQAEGASSSYGQRGAAWYWLDRELSSDVAGETGAVCIYKGAVAALRWRGHDEASSSALAFCSEHEAAEAAHLAYYLRLVPEEMRTCLLPAWRAAGFGLGFVPTALAGEVGLFATVRSVETFVEKHYLEQIRTLEADAGFSADADGRELIRLLKHCCADEVHHRDDAAARLGDADGALVAAWGVVVEAGSAVAAEVARRV